MSAARDRPEPLRELVVCSLEAWNEVWRRNQFLVAELLGLEPHLRVLFVEPAVDVALELVARHRLVRGSGLRVVEGTGGGRMHALEPTKVLPRAAGPAADRSLLASVRHHARALGFSAPLLWVNDPAYAPLVLATSWPTLYDVTDDWLLAERPARERSRLFANEATLLERAGEVVVCSAALAESKGRLRPVRLVANAVDAARLRTAQPRPADLPSGPVVLYLGTLHRDRLDVALCARLAGALAGEASLVLVGPDALEPAEREQLSREAPVHVLGARPYPSVPGYLQHADVLVAPHVRNAFTDSLDPIKAHEYRAVGRPVVATPVAGFRGLPRPVVVAEGDDFVAAVREALVVGPRPPALGPLAHDVATWRDRAVVMRESLRRLATGTAAGLAR